MPYDVAKRRRSKRLGLDKKTNEKTPKLTQNPHSLRSSDREKVLEVAIGREVRAFRRQKEITVAELAQITGLSIGMLSKIENGNTSPSLTTLQILANALSVPLTSFFRRFEERREAVHTKSGEGVELEREGTRANHQYNLLGHIGANGSGVIVEPYLITLSEESDVFPTFQHGGIETIYMLEGQVEYRHGDETYLLEAGDTLFFDADAPHGPEKLVELPARYLSIISYPQNT
ncbi:DNA-binding protein, putative [Roseobacter sp. SK209-2-6]|uniref:helix-turn-helix domain-containing protein n=1 Tax=Roseobacter sp. SK209-2-6 TaxID=388739 RepID=UPI0000F3C21E|nr:XRE family transcriptional regulator [Roseobacter sp. SK209-2-6]EBA15442.1 DNA-binding protein, putative [Roseobacter sp. SK209-2-6]